MASASFDADAMCDMLLNMSAGDIDIPAALSSGVASAAALAAPSALPVAAAALPAAAIVDAGGDATAVPQTSGSRVCRYLAHWELFNVKNFVILFWELNFCLLPLVISNMKTRIIDGHVLYSYNFFTND